jgi:hypothetical protein
VNKRDTGGDFEVGENFDERLFDERIDRIWAEVEAEAERKRAKANGNHAGHDGAAPKPVLEFIPLVLPDPKLIRPRAWLYGRHYIRRYCSLTVSPGGAGKSTLISTEAIEMATGRCLLHDKPHKPLNVLLINGEDPRDELIRRVAAITQHYGITDADLGGRLALVSGRDYRLTLTRPTQRGIEIDEGEFDILLAVLQRHGVDVLILDPLASFHRIPENDNVGMDALARRLTLLAELGNASVEIVHHTRKAATGSNGLAEPSMDEARGASSLAAAVRVGRIIRKMSSDEAAGFGITNDRDRYFRTIGVKANMAPPALGSKWFRLHGVDLGNADGEYPSDNVAVVNVWTPPDAFQGVTSADLLEVMRRVDEAQREDKRLAKDQRSKNWVGNVVASVLKIDANDKAVRRRIGAIVDTWVKHRRLKIVKARDKRNARDFDAVEVGEWPE